MPRDKDDFSQMPESKGLEDFRALDKLLADVDEADADGELDPLDDPDFFEDPDNASSYSEGLDERS